MNNSEHIKNFKTNIKCGGCITTVKPFLNKILPEDSWQVNTENKDKILSVQAGDVSTDEIIKQVQAAGFKIEIAQ